MIRKPTKAHARRTGEKIHSDLRKGKHHVTMQSLEEPKSELTRPKNHTVFAANASENGVRVLYLVDSNAGKKNAKKRIKKLSFGNIDLIDFKTFSQLKGKKQYGVIVDERSTNDRLMKQVYLVKGRVRKRFLVSKKHDR